MELIKAWVQVDNQVSPLALARESEYSSEAVMLKFNRHPAAIALCRGKKWRITSEFEKFEVMETKIINGAGQLKLRSAQQYDCYIYPALKETACYYFKGEGTDKTPITLEVVDKVTAKNQIAIAEFGKVVTSANLNDKIIQAYHKVKYQQATETLTEDIEILTAHLLFLENERWKYLGLCGAQMEPINETKIRIKNWGRERDAQL